MLKYLKVQSKVATVITENRVDAIKGVFTLETKS